MQAVIPSLLHIRKNDNIIYILKFLLARHLKNEVSIFLPNLKGRDTTKTENQETKGRSSP